MGLWETFFVGEPHIRARRKVRALAQRKDYEALRTYLAEWYSQTESVLVELGTSQAVELLDESTRNAHGCLELWALEKIAKSGKSGSGLALTCLKKHAARDWDWQQKAKEIVQHIDPLWAVDSFLKRIHEANPPILELLHEAQSLAAVLPKERLPQVADRFDKLCTSCNYREVRHLLPPALRVLEYLGMPVSEAVRHLQELIACDPTEADKFIGQVREIQDRIANAPSPPKSLPLTESVICICHSGLKSASEAFAGMVVSSQRLKAAPGWIALGELSRKEGELVQFPYWVAYPGTDKMDSWIVSCSRRLEELGLTWHGSDHFLSNSQGLLRSTTVICVYIA